MRVFVVAECKADQWLITLLEGGDSWLSGWRLERCDLDGMIFWRTYWILFLKMNMNE